MRRLLKLLYHDREGRDRRYYFDGSKYLGAGYSLKKVLLEYKPPAKILIHQSLLK